MRKIVQIVCESRASFPITYALCNDGTFWILSSSPKETWLKMPAIPQDGYQLDHVVLQKENHFYDEPLFDGDES